MHHGSYVVCTVYDGKQQETRHLLSESGELYILGRHTHLLSRHGIHYDELGASSFVAPLCSDLPVPLAPRLASSMDGEDEHVRQRLSAARLATRYFAKPVYLLQVVAVVTDVGRRFPAKRYYL